MSELEMSRDRKCGFTTVFPVKSSDSAVAISFRKPHSNKASLNSDGARCCKKEGEADIEGRSIEKIYWKQVASMGVEPQQRCIISLLALILFFKHRIHIYLEHTQHFSSHEQAVLQPNPRATKLLTGTVIAPIVAHSICNNMGLPLFGHINNYSKKSTRLIFWLSYIAGFVIWISLLNPLTDQNLYKTWHALLYLVCIPATLCSGQLLIASLRT
ncbi:unnamed protein product [Dracunculus medinensis]|uniref:Rhomboid domain-containing protein n=1 Tax=Dracunculus medinensis TaxID=318479 RepID=A0A0N4U142_DRAME|nr:unnamed protein product [Dracunculus medinensis]